MNKSKNNTTNSGAIVSAHTAKLVLFLVVLFMMAFMAVPLRAGDKANSTVALKTTAETTKPLTVDQIVARTNLTAYYQGADGRARVQMQIVSATGQKRNREFTILRWDEPNPKTPKETLAQKAKDTYCGQQKMYVYFHRPADVNKMAFMVWKHIKGDDDRWLYLPALDLVKRIAATDKRTSFVGSNFFYEDVSGRNINEDKHELIKTTKNYYVLKNTPKNPKTVEFSYYIMWIYKKNFVVVETDYYNKQGKKYRSYRALKVETIQGYPTVTRAIMSDLQNGGYTTLSYSDVKYNLNIPESIFKERYLRKPPRKYLR